MINVIIADDHQIVVDGLVSLLESEKDICVKATANNGEEALRAIGDHRIDVAILDINMPVMDGLEATRVIGEQFPETKVLILSMYNESEHISELLEAGCSGYILKNKGHEELVTAINTIVGGSDYFGQKVLQSIINEKKNPKKKLSDFPIKLTKREIEVLKLIAQDHSTPEIAEMLFISPTTVDTHRRNLISKLDVRSSYGLVRYAFENGLME